MIFNKIKQFAIIAIISIFIFLLGKAGVLSSQFAGTVVSYVSPSAGKVVEETLNECGARLRGQGTDFETAKRNLRKIYKNHPEWRKTIYCQAEFSKHWEVKFPEGFTYPTKYQERAERIEWEHMVPAENFGRHFVEWRDGIPECEGQRGRACARMNAEFRRMEGDMHNLFPSIGAVNAVRSNYRYQALEAGTMPFGSCPVIIRDRTFSPPEHARGVAARASLYMARQYKDTIPHLFSDAQIKLFEAWNRMYPPEPWECERNKEIRKFQGTTNPYIICRPEN